ncbi:MAG: ferric reductase-like transmembrane domain-containing protein [Alphaproteobacteria bacterium]|nr:ferric reductase-like transmembrane domain-containing protein [Alphaproteobacteria bacterium]
MFSARLASRLLRHHLPLALISIAVTAALYFTRPYPQMIPRLAFATAYPALILLCVTLLLGPWKFFMGERLQVSFDLRRDIGIWAGILGLIHTGVGQFVHMAGKFWLYYIYDNWQAKHVQPFRHDIFGFSNDTGLLAALVLLALLATSNDASLRWLSTPGWKSLQRWNYACFVLTAAHTFGYQTGVGGGRGWYLVLSIAAVSITLVLQLIGWRRRRAAALTGKYAAASP